MNAWLNRLGVYPFLLLGMALFIFGGLALLYIVDTIWLFDVEQRLDLARATVLGRADSTVLWQAALPDVLITFFGLILASVTGLVLPLVFFLNKRFGQSSTPPFIVTIRQSLWVGLWVTICIYLQMNRTLGIAVAALVAVVLAIFEFLLQVRERASVE